MKSAMCCSEGIASLIPQTLFSPLSIEETSPAPTGSVTVPNTIGMSLIEVARASATGVAIPTATFTRSSLYLSAICAAVFTSPLAFCKSYWAEKPFSFTTSITPFSTASRAGCWTIFAIPIFTVFEDESFLAQPKSAAQAARAAIIFASFIQFSLASELI